MLYAEVTSKEAFNFFWTRDADLQSGHGHLYTTKNKKVKNAWNRGSMYHVVALYILNDVLEPNKLYANDNATT